MKKFSIVILILLTSCTPDIKYKYGDRVRCHNVFYGNRTGIIDDLSARGIGTLYYHITTDDHVPNFWVYYTQIDGLVYEKSK
jgi:hypothetical protein